jgi:hypothetical protein
LEIFEEVVLKRFLFIFCGALFMAVAGCVPISQNVSVQYPSPIDPSNNTLYKCTPQAYPHRLIITRISAGSPLLQTDGGAVNDQVNFDRDWSQLSPDFDEKNTSADTLAPVINWEQETANFMPVFLDNSCEKAKPYGDQMTTDCYTVAAPILRYTEGGNCQHTVTTYPVFVYIYPKTGMPVSRTWVYFTPTPTLLPTVTATPKAIPTATPTPESEEE